MIARNATGALGVMAASMMLRETDQQGEDYKLVPVGDGTVLDVTPLFPLRQFFFLGKILNEYYFLNNLKILFDFFAFGLSLSLFFFV